MPRSPGSKTGVIARDAHIQIDLRAQGFGRERLEIPPTGPNLALAARMRQEILGKIERGTFVLAEYFPDSPRVAKDTGSLTWKNLCTEWLRIKKPDVAHSTLNHYEQTLTSKHFADWEKVHLPDLNFRRLKTKLAELPEHPKTWNNVASVLSMVLEYGYKAKLLREPLHEHIESRTNPEPEPDPFTLAEIDVILSKMRHPVGRNLYEFAFFTGMRPSELIALRWSDVDLRLGNVMVRAAVVRSKEKGTKTGKKRLVELVARARAALERQRPLTQLKGEFVFLGLDGEPYTTTDGPLDAFWKPAMKLSGIRYRDARQTRHTYATLGLHTGRKPGWMAKQLGHTVEMFYRVYSKWVEAQDAGAERAAFDKALAGPAAAEDQTGT